MTTEAQPLVTTDAFQSVPDDWQAPAQTRKGAGSGNKAPARRKRYDVLSRETGRLMFSTDSELVAQAPLPGEVVWDRVTGRAYYGPTV
ncbi:hypothetical protein [Puerhibacterium puerhi]|uniref:hypothetical protein n=1 Tax=Puerhibacterium puerhi TaxID=2692623 RepID=UPI001359CC36|nr:hypothetical protein [Puerhibacterium puerhi]